MADEDGPNAGTSKKTVHLDDENLDAEEALFGSNITVILPCPDAPVFNNLAEYVSRTFPKKPTETQKEVELKNRAEVLEQQCAAPVIKHGSAVAAKRKLEELHRPPDRLEKKNLTVFDKMESCAVGPYSMLLKSLNQKIKVLVRRRKKCPSREERFCWTEGCLIAFDKHFNVILKDVSEKFDHYIPRTKRTVTIVRKIDQMMIRGDNVILVSKPDK